MVCNRCIMVVSEILRKSGLTPLSIGLGTVVLREALTHEGREALRPALEACGFELIDDKRMRLIEQIRTAVIELVRTADDSPKPTLSAFLSERLHRDYSALSKLFSETCGVSIEKYHIAQKIERVKELLVYDELTLSQIADLLRYSSVAHLSAQFRQVTGIPASEFRRSNGKRLPLDKIGRL